MASVISSVLALPPMRYLGRISYSLYRFESNVRSASVVGIVGAGQLARMMAQAAIPLGIELTLLAASADDGAAKVVPNFMISATPA